MKIRNAFEQHKTLFLLWGLFFISVIVRTIIAAFPKHILVLYDELIYYSYAENLARGRGFPMIYQFLYNHQSRFLYSILISPAFLTHNRILQFRLIALINSLILSSGIFPTYLLAKDVINSKKWGIICGVLFILMPDMVYSISFMADIPMLPLGLWIIYAIYSIFDPHKRSNKVLMIVTYCILQLVVIWLKKSGIVFCGVLLFMLIAYYIIPSIKKGNVDVKSISLACIYVALFGCILIGVFRLTGFDDAIKGEVITIWNSIRNSGYEFVKYYCYFGMQIALALAIVPISVSYIYCLRFDEKGKRLLYVISITMLLYTVSINRISFIYRDIGRVHLRYLMFLWMPYIILFCKFLTLDIEKSKKIERIGWGIFIPGILAIFALYHGPHKASDIEYTMLYWVEKWGNYRNVYIITIFIIVVIVMILIHNRKNRVLGILMLFVWLGIQSYNNVMAFSRYKELYNMNISEIGAVESFIKEHPNEVFVVFNTGNSCEYESAELFNYLSTKISDTFFNYPNVLRVSLANLVEKEKNNSDENYNISNNPLRVDLFMLDKYYDYDMVDYIVIPNDAGAQVDEKCCSEVDVGMNQKYKIYKLTDKEVIPHIDSIRYIYEGQYTYPIEEDVFSSQYFENEEMVFESVEDNQMYVLYGPYIKLKPGDYRFILNYSYNGDKEQGELGFADINGAGIDAEEYKKPIMASNNSVEIDYHTEEAVDQFEVRAFAEAKGIKMDTIEIIYSMDNKSQ